MLPPPLAERPRSLAGPAARNVMSRKTSCRPGQVVWSMYCGRLGWGILERGVAGRLFGQVRFDLLLQISPSVSERRACYVLRHRPLITSFLLVGHRGGPRDWIVLLPLYRRTYGVFVPNHPPKDRTSRRPPRRRHRHLALRPLRRLPRR